VQTAEIIFNTREELLKQTSGSWMNHSVFNKLLLNPLLMHKASLLLRLAEVVGLDVAAKKLGFAELLKDASQAEVAALAATPRTRLDAIVRLTEKIKNPRYRVAYFVGCYAANFAPGEAAATIRVLKEKVEVEVCFVCWPSCACLWGYVYS
jgi:Fe-S oxidoreductase